jgi:hypothetical protein
LYPLKVVILIFAINALNEGGMLSFFRAELDDVENIYGKCIESIRGHERPGYLGKGLYISTSQIMAICEKGAKFV